MQTGEAMRYSKLFSLLIVVLSVSISAQYSTPNTGVNWTIDDLVLNSGGVVMGSYPAYTITQEVTVSAADRLTVPGGSEITFSVLNSGLYSQGILRIEGTPQLNVMLKGAAEDSTGSWQGLKFEDTSIDGENIVTWTYINSAYYGVRAINASPVVEDCYFYKCRRGLNLSGSDAVLKRSVIERSYEYGINMTLSSSPLIETNYLFDNNTQNTSAKNQISVGLQGNNSPVIRSNHIKGSANSKTGGISIWVSGSTSFSNSVIENNLIENNAFGITLYSSSNGIVNVLVKNNVIKNNNIGPDPMTSGSGINLNGSSFNTPVITRNTITGNLWGITLQNGTTVQAGPQPNIGNIENADTTDDGYNSIYDNGNSGMIYDLYNNCTNDVYAQNNDWGVYDSASVEEHIYHKTDNAAHGFVKYMPFYEPIVPVELLSFTCLQEKGSVRLAWQTATETNNAGFRILRNNREIGFVTGSGSVAEVVNYSFNDDNPLSGRNFYELYQLDFIGSLTKIAETTLLFDAIPSDFRIIGAYPNPFNPSTTVEYYLPEESNMEIRVFNIRGEEVNIKSYSKKQAGKNTARLDFSDNPSGVYFIQLSDKDNTITKSVKVMLIK